VTEGVRGARARRGLTYARNLARRPRSILPDGILHVTARGVAGSPIFLDEKDRRRFDALLAETIERHRRRCHVYCQMGTHYHVVIETLRDRLSAGMHHLNGCYAAWFNRRHRRRGHLFENRYRAWVVLDDEHLEHTLEYVLDNPVRAGLCPTRDDWLWSGPRPRA
jgi:REP element-mobilizing transposase RayT